MSVTPKATVAVLGTGTMGEPVARNLLRAGFPVRAWNRTRVKAELLGQEGAVIADTSAEAVDGAEVIVTFLVDGNAVEDVMARQGAAAAAQPGTVWIQSSTVGVRAAERLIELAKKHGLVFVDAPVLGSRPAAEKGELVVFASGPEEARERCAPVFEVIAKTTRWVGEAGAGNRLKVVVNSWLIALVEAAAEAITLAKALGLDPNEFLEAVKGAPIDTPYLQLKGKAMIERRFEPAFKLALAEKDARLILEATREAGIDLPLLTATREAFARALQLGHGDEDMAAVIEALTADPVSAS